RRPSDLRLRTPESFRGRARFAQLENLSADSAPRELRQHEHRADVRRIARRIEKSVVIARVRAAAVRFLSATPSAAADDRRSVQDDEVSAVIDELVVGLTNVRDRAVDLLLVVDRWTELAQRLAHHARDAIDVGSGR